MVAQGSLKDTCCPFETCCFFHRNKGEPPFTSCNVQVYNASGSLLRQEYVYHALRRDAEAVLELLSEDGLGCLYVCGSASTLAKDVTNVLVDLLSSVVAQFSFFFGWFKHRVSRFARLSGVSQRNVLRGNVGSLCDQS